MEIANGYNQFNDPMDQRQRFLSHLRELERGDEESHLFFFNDTPTTEIYTPSLHDALPISSAVASRWKASSPMTHMRIALWPTSGARDRKSTRLNSSHVEISYAVFCLE